MLLVVIAIIFVIIKYNYDTIKANKQYEESVRDREARKQYYSRKGGTKL